MTGADQHRTDLDKKRRFRIARLRDELEQEEIPLLGFEVLPDGLRAAPSEVEHLMLEEIVNARFIPVHEGRRPSFGVLIVPSVSDYVGPTLGEPENFPGVEAARSYVDGLTTVLLRDPAGAAAVAQLDVSDELQLVRTVACLQGVSIQRLLDGRIRVSTRGCVVINDGHDWTVRPHANNQIPELFWQLDLPPKGRKETFRELRSLLEFCFHRLSPDGIGATLVVVLDGDIGSLSGGISDPGKRPALAINVFQRDSQRLLYNLLASVDGACIVERDGVLAFYGAKLLASESITRLIGEMGGTRHTSAKRFSYQFPQTLVIVVSADGPVTLFCNGVRIVDLQSQREPANSWRTQYPVDRQSDVGDVERVVSCPKCERVTYFNLTVDPDRGDTRTLSCAVCGATSIAEDHVVRLRSRTGMPWSRERG